MRSAAVMLAVVALAGCGGGEERGELERRDRTTTAAIDRVAVASPERRPGALLRDLRDRESREDERLDAAATSLVNRSIHVFCWSAMGWRQLEELIGDDLGEEGFEAVGTVDPLSYDVHLHPDICRDLADMGEPSLILADGLYTLAHEVTHLTRGSNEAVVSCYGLQLVDDLARELGVSSADARELAEMVWEEIYPFGPPGYVSEECRPGGTLDADPATGEWP